MNKKTFLSVLSAQSALVTPGVEFLSLLTTPGDHFRWPFFSATLNIVQNERQSKATPKRRPARHGLDLERIIRRWLTTCKRVVVHSREEAARSAAEAISSNVAKITALEEEALARRTGGERMGDTVARHAGRMWFLLFHVVWFVVWIAINLGIIPGLRVFDPFPFSFLTLVVSLESIFLSLFILMSQNRATRQADSRSHLDLQINLLAEQESTKILQMLQQLCELHGLSAARDPEVDVLTKSTKPEELLGELNECLPENK